MLIINGTQYKEGIDGIDLLLRNTIYQYLDENVVLDPKHYISIYSKYAKIPLENGNYSIKSYHYLHISGESINPLLPIKETISIAIFRLIITGKLKVRDRKNNMLYDNIAIEFIKENLKLFITGISRIEFCFDFKEENIKIDKDALIIKENDGKFHDFLKMKQNDRPKCLIKIGTTYYSYDYNKRRKSTLKLYNRQIWLLKKNNEYPKDFILNNPYKLRIEFVLEGNKNTTYLSLKNMEGNYYDTLKKFLPYLANLFDKYFFELISIDGSRHYYFSQIYQLAWTKRYTKRPDLNTVNNERIPRERKNSVDSDLFSKLYYGMQKENNKNDKIQNKTGDDYFADLPDIMKNKIESKWISPTDRLFDEKIHFIDNDGDIFYKNSIYNPKFKEIDNE